MKIVDLTPRADCPPGLHPINLLIDATLSTKAGVTVAEIRERLKVLELLEQARDTGAKSLQLEDFAHATLASVVSTCPWGLVNPFVVFGCDAVLEAKSPPAGSVSDPEAS